MLLVMIGQQEPRALLNDVLMTLLGVAPAVDRSCPDCERQHGKPVLNHPTLHANTSDSAGLALVAVTDAGPIGVDVELVERAAFEDFDDVALGPADRAVGSDERARLWTRKEAVLKATGEGLRTDPRTVDVTGTREPVRGAELYDVAVPSVWRASVAVLAEHRPELEIRSHAWEPLLEQPGLRHRGGSTEMG